jgi:hypothetical protein
MAGDDDIVTPDATPSAMAARSASLRKAGASCGKCNSADIQLVQGQVMAATPQVTGRPRALAAAIVSGRRRWRFV